MGPWTTSTSDLNVDNGPLSGRPMAQYFKPLSRKQRFNGFDNLGPFHKNMYLAEDRVLCFELVSKRNQSNVLRYVKGAVAETDPMDSLSGLITQRRRWLNGSLFAKLYAFKHFYKIHTLSNHSYSAKCYFTLQFIYLFIQFLMDMCSVSLFFVQFRVATDLCLRNNDITNSFSLFGSHVHLNLLSDILQVGYMIVIMLLIITSVAGCKPKSKFTIS